MSDRILAVTRLNLSNDTQILRHKGEYVRLVAKDTTQLMIPREDWQAVADFFTSISHKNALL